MGCLLTRNSLTSSPTPSSSGVLMKPGPTEFTRTPCAEYSSAAVFVMPTTACFAATYAGDVAKPTLPRIEAMLTTEPPPFARIEGICAFMLRKTALRLMAMTLSQASSVYSAVGAAAPPMPALFTPMRSGARVFASSTDDAIQALSVASPTEASAVPPAARISSTTAFALSALRSFTTTAAPLRARRRAVERPIPLPAPVTIAERFATSYWAMGGLLPGRARCREIFSDGPSSSFDPTPAREGWMRMNGCWAGCNNAARGALPPFTPAANVQPNG